MKNKRQRVAVPGSNRSKKPRVSILRLKSKNLPAVQRKAHVLGRLVPGCWKEPLSVILEETTDYIAALEMQVKATSVLSRSRPISAPKNQIYAPVENQLAQERESEEQSWMVVSIVSMY